MDTPLLSGIDHIYLSVTDMEVSEAFYDRVMQALGLRKGDKAIAVCYRKLIDCQAAPTPPKHYPEYHPEYYATFFSDPDGVRLEVVSRTSYLLQLADRCNEFDRVLIPLQGLD